MRCSPAGISRCPNFDTTAEAIAHYYENPTNDSQNGDEFVTVRTIGDDWASTRVADGDTVLFYNYRGDRPREITRAFVMDEFYGHAVRRPTLVKEASTAAPNSTCSTSR